MPCLNKLKIVLIGSAGVGKTSIFRRLLGLDFNGSHQSTMGAAFHAINMLQRPDQRLMILSPQDALAHFEGGTKWSLQVWDTAGQERYDSLIPMYYRGAHIAFAVHDGLPDTINNISRLITRVRKETPRCVVCLIHNKSDLPNFRYNQELVDTLKPDHACSTSALQNKNIIEALCRACHIAIGRLPPRISEEKEPLPTCEKGIVSTLLSYGPMSSCSKCNV